MDAAAARPERTAPSAMDPCCAARSDFFFGPSTAGVFPPVNVFRDAEGDVVIRAELPGREARGLRGQREQPAR